MSESQNFNYSGQQTFTGAYNDSDSLKIRMDSSPLIEQIYSFLTGKVAYIANREGEEVTIYEQRSKPLCTEDGARSICNFILLQCNPQVFQGNIDKEEKGKILSRLHKVLAFFIMANRDVFDLELSNYDNVVESIITFLELQLSGLVGGFRTTSFNAAHKTVEQTTVKDKGGFFRR